MLDSRAFRGCEALLVLPELHAALRHLDLRLALHEASGLDQQGDLVGERDREGIHLDRRLPPGDRGLHRRERDRGDAESGGSARDPRSQRGAALGLGRRGVGAGRETPCSVHQHAHAEPQRAGLLERRHPPVLHLEKLGSGLHEANVGVGGACELGGVQGAIEDLVHVVLHAAGNDRLCEEKRVDSVRRS